MQNTIVNVLQKQINTLFFVVACLFALLFLSCSDTESNSNNPNGGSNDTTVVDTNGNNNGTLEWGGNLGQIGTHLFFRTEERVGSTTHINRVENAEQMGGEYRFTIVDFIPNHVEEVVFVWPETEEEFVSRYRNNNQMQLGLGSFYMLNGFLVSSIETVRVLTRTQYTIEEMARIAYSHSKSSRINFVRRNIAVANTITFPSLFNIATQQDFDYVFSVMLTANGWGSIGGVKNDTWYVYSIAKQ